MAAKPLPIIAGVVRTTVRGLAPSGRQWANVIHGRYAGGASSPGSADIAAWDALLIRLYSGAIFTGGAPWLAACGSGWTIIDTTSYRLDGLSTPQIITHAVAGTGGTGTLPCEVSHVLTVRTAKRGRSYRGRIYLPAVISGNVTTAGNISTTLINTTVAQATGILAALGGAGAAPFWELGVASYLHSTFEPATYFTMDAKPDVQRRRK